MNWHYDYNLIYTRNMFPNSYSFNPGVVLDPVTMTPMIGGSSFTVNPFGVPAKPQQKVWQKMFIKEIPIECSNQNMVKLLKEFAQIKNYKRTNNSRGELLTFCYFDLETGEQILRFKRLFKNIRLLDKTLQLRISSETENFIKEWLTIQKDQWRKKLISPQMNEAKQFDTIEDFFQKEDLKYKQKIQEKLRQINVDVKKAAIERMRQEQKKEHPKQKQRERKKKRHLEEMQRNFHQSQDYWIKRQRGKVKHFRFQEKQYRKEKQKQKEREKAKIRRLQRQIDLDSEQEQKRIEKFLTSDRLKMIDKEQQEDLQALEEENPPLPQEEIPIVQEKKSRFYLGQEIKLGQQTINEVVVKVGIQNENQMEDQGIAKPNAMFQNWQADEDKHEQKRVIDLKLPEVNQNNKEYQTEIKRKIAQLEQQVPKNKRDLWQYPIDWDLLSKSVVLIKNIRPWLEQQSYEYMGSMQQKFVALVQKKIFSRSHPDKIIKIISQLIDDDAQQFVMKLWKRIVLEFLKLKHGIN